MTLNLPQNEVPAIIVNIMFLVAIYLTYSLMLYVPVEILKPKVCKYFSNHAHHNMVSLLSFDTKDGLKNDLPLIRPTYRRYDGTVTFI